MMKRVAASLLCFAFALSTAFGQSHAVSSWPQFRGPNGMGVAENAGKLPQEFGESKNLLWKSAIQGEGWSSPVLTSDRVWFTVARPQGERAEQKSNAGIKFTYPSIDLLLLSYDRQTGKPVHEIPLFTAKQPEAIHSLNTYASPTPCVGAGAHGTPVVYCHFGTFGTAAVDVLSGDVLWRNNKVHLEHSTGPGSSPILFRDLLIFHADGIDTQSVVALKTNDGSVAWRTDRSGEMSAQPEMKKAFCTPLLTMLDGQPRLISTGADWMYLYDPATGEEIFKVPYGKLGFSTVPRPVFHDDTAYLCTGFMKGRLLAVNLSGSPAKDGSSRIEWEVARQVPTMPSPVLIGDRLLMVSDGGIATCLDRESGETVWTERLGGKYSASPLLADGKIFIGNQDGEMLVLKPGDQLELLATNQLDSDIMASPAAVDGKLFVRTKKSLYCFGAK
ncbi:MAG: PQQ-like beta-propeller repeat protein [Planctomycetaceae bacterium]|nr:PQQ-like beta-propeller repeat protein [Planctomycetaceae bacterium]